MELKSNIVILIDENIVRICYPIINLLLHPNHETAQNKEKKNYYITSGILRLLGWMVGNALHSVILNDLKSVVSIFGKQK